MLKLIASLLLALTLGSAQTYPPPVYFSILNYNSLNPNQQILSNIMNFPPQVQFLIHGPTDADHYKVTVSYQGVYGGTRTTSVLCPAVQPGPGAVTSCVLYIDAAVLSTNIVDIYTTSTLTITTSQSSN